MDGWPFCSLGRFGPTGTTTATLARTSDGPGVCKPATTQTCTPFACNGTTCTAVCAMDSDCAPGNVCNSGSCGKKRLGQICAAGAACDSGNCVMGPGMHMLMAVQVEADFTMPLIPVSAPDAQTVDSGMTLWGDLVRARTQSASPTTGARTEKTP